MSTSLARTNFLENYLNKATLFRLLPVRCWKIGSLQRWEGIQIFVESDGDELE